MLVADTASHEIVELVRRYLLAWGPTPNPQIEGFALPKVAVEMHAIGPRPEERDGAAVEAKDGRRAPARRDIEAFIAPLRDAALSDERVHHPVDGAAHRRNIAACNQLHPLLCDRENIGESLQRLGIVAPQKPDPRVPGG